ncbi:hypothetical protein AB0I82_23710 [Streptomyces sp. NPDC050315]|uniref:hypothetical protein n=1 Tax=Streptomyces sp. NPDC050315 TaxID=3155039 RepID=UPI0034317E38
MDSQTLVSSAKRWMHAGLDAFARDTDLDFAVHHFGVATEHALKAFLASYHPALVADPNDFAGLLHATGHGVLANTGMTNTKTVSAALAFQRCNSLLKPPLPFSKEKFQTFLNARNGVSHLGVHEKNEVRQHLVTSIRIVDRLLSELTVSRELFWGDYRELHDELLQERADDLKLAYQRKVAVARRVFSALDPQIGAYDLGRIAAIYGLADEEEELAQCPVCGRSGRLTGMHSVERRDDVNRSDDDEDWVVILYPLNFTCPTCQLDLGSEFFELAGLPSAVPTAHDPADWWEPDEDLDRGR